MKTLFGIIPYVIIGMMIISIIFVFYKSMKNSSVNKKQKYISNTLKRELEQEK